MSADWKAGDRALCVDDSPHRNGRIYGTPSGLAKGRIYLVEAINPSSGGFGLIVSGVSTGIFHTKLDTEIPYDPNRFRKIVPACDRVSVEQEQEVAP